MVGTQRQTADVFQSSSEQCSEVCLNGELHLVPPALYRIPGSSECFKVPDCMERTQDLSPGFLVPPAINRIHVLLNSDSVMPGELLSKVLIEVTLIWSASTTAREDY